MGVFSKSVGGKNNKVIYYAGCYFRYYLPDFIFRINKKHILKSYNSLSTSERSYIDDRVEYYCKLITSEPKVKLSEKALTAGSHTLKNKDKYSSVYFHDTFEFLRCYDKHLRWSFIPGDVIDVPREPSILKSRPILGNNCNSVLLKLNKIRHFCFLNDNITYSQKIDKAIFRGYINKKPRRVEFMEKFFDSPICDAGDVSTDSPFPHEWKKPKITIQEHLKYKFILALEGVDVASNLKWIMSSNSVAVMPEPTYETWFMEGRLIPNHHYIEVEADFSDFEEKINYYLAHPEEAEQIARNANEYIAQFKNKKREKLISFLVLEKYFQCVE